MAIAIAIEIIASSSQSRVWTRLSGKVKRFSSHWDFLIEFFIAWPQVWTSGFSNKQLRKSKIVFIISIFTNFPLLIFLYFLFYFFFLLCKRYNYLHTDVLIEIKKENSSFSFEFDFTVLPSANYESVCFHSK